MKLIKKIAAIMFAFMMVVSMSCNVKAVEGASPGTTGTLTINKVKENQTYKLYKVLDLESFSGDKSCEKITLALMKTIMQSGIRMKMKQPFVFSHKKHLNMLILKN